MGSKHTTILAFDFGLRHIGVAAGNTLLGTALALPVLAARNGVPDWDVLGAVVAEWQPDLLVVGDPLNMDDSVGEMAERARKFARQLHGRLGLPVTLVDERLSSAEAKAELRAQGHRGDYVRAPADSVAARLILQTWLAESGDSAG